MNTALENFLASFRFAHSTKAFYRRAIDQLPHSPTMSAAELLNFVCRPEWGPSTQHSAFYACRKFITWLYGSNHPALIAKFKRIKPKPQRVLTHALALNLLASFDTSTCAGARDLAIAALALDTGLRCSELCRVTLEDTNIIERKLQVIVKGGQWQSAVFSQQTAFYISHWLSLRGTTRSSALFVSLHHKRAGLPLTREGLQGIVKRWGISIGIKLSPHDLRRTFATLATIYGAPTRIVQVAGRWNTLDMVTHYTASLEQNAIEPFLPVSHLTQTNNS